MSAPGASSNNSDANKVPKPYTVKPVFEDKFVFETIIQKDGQLVELWHNPKTGASETRALDSKRVIPQPLLDAFNSPKPDEKGVVMEVY